MENPRNLALIGAALLFVGAFMPIVSMPIVGNINYFANGRGDGTIVVLLALLTAFLAYRRLTRITVWTGLASLAVMGFTFFRLQSAIGDMKDKMNTELADNPFRGLADAMIQTVQLQWGWAILVLGGLLVTFAGWKARGSDLGADTRER